MADRSSPQTDAEKDKDEMIQRECEKLFHPERFDLHDLTTSISTLEAANPDLGALFYAQNIKPASNIEKPSENVSNDEDNKRVVVLEDPKSGELFQPIRKYGRSMSSQDPPKYELLDFNLRRNYNFSGSLENVSHGHHDEEIYPHYHSVLSRHRTHRSMSNLEKEKPRKGKIIKEGIATMPTILDEETKEEVTREKTPSDVSKCTESTEKILELHEDMAAVEGQEDQTADENDQDADIEDEKVTFLIGQHTDEEENEIPKHRQMIYDNNVQTKKKRRKKKKSKRKHSSFTEQELKLRSTIGSELAEGFPSALHTDIEEANVLENKDLDEITHHRLDHYQGLSKHIIRKKSSAAMLNIKKETGTAQAGEHQKSMMDKIFFEQRTIDHSPHNLFVEMDELINDEWVEQSRWIKYEEAREPGSERWGKPHVSSLSFHSLLNLRLNLEKGAILLDHEGKDLTNVLSSIVEALIGIGYIDDEIGSILLRILLYRHKYVDGKTFKKLHSGSYRQKSMASIYHTDYSGDSADEDEQQHDSSTNHNWHKFSRSFSKRDSELQYQQGKSLLEFENGNNASNNYSKNGINGTSHTVVEMSGMHDTTLSAPCNNSQDFKSQFSQESKTSFHASGSIGENLHKIGKKPAIMLRVPEDTEGALTLVGNLELIDEPLTAFVRLEEGILMPNALEIPIPVRFIFLLLTPKSDLTIDCHEVGRSFSTLMSNPKFHTVCYKVEERKELLNAINDFLDESVVLPPGDWESRNLLSMSEMHELRNRKRKLNKDDKLDLKKSEDELTVIDTESYLTNPLLRAPGIFGGLINDLRRRSKWYWSDFKDGFNSQTFAAAIFIYFAGLSGAVAFGGLLGEKTGNLIGISETLLLSSVGGTLFALFSGMPLIITGVTGPLLLYDESLFGICSDYDIDYLSIRVWTGLWMIMISLIVAMFQGSLFVKYLTKFTKEIFSALVSLLYTFEALKKLSKIYAAHPLEKIDNYCDQQNISDLMEPNTALLSTILMFGTFMVAYGLRAVKASYFFGRTIRRSLGDFGVPIAIVIMVVADLLVQETYTEKLKVPDGFQVTLPENRTWIIEPLGQLKPLEVWMPVAAFLPAIALYMLLFVETHICELIMIEKTGNVKGAGLHWDIVLLCIINAISAIFGGPWLCAATVRAVAHVSALTVMSTTHAPGEKARVVEVKDQRLSALAVSLLIGLSLFLSPLLKHIPYAVLFGVFLYMGISSMSGIQMFERIVLFIKPVKHHPRVNYVRRVKTWKMHLFTVLQTFGLIVLWIVKSSALALAFPFFVLGMIPYRVALKFIFTSMELEALDGKQAGASVEEDEHESEYHKL